MNILSIETSCDETAIAILECEGREGRPTSFPQSAEFRVRAHALISQIEIHRQYGGVFPAVAKREHAMNLVPLLRGALEEAELLHESVQVYDDELRTRIAELLSREATMAEGFLELLSEIERPDIDAIAVTYGPGLEPALWVGINFAQALALAWNIPLVPVNHMEGHLFVALAKQNESNSSLLTISDVGFPVLALLISGGHTEIDLMEDWLSYKLLGQTRDDAVGEAFDKVARLLGLPYPGGPEISTLAAKDREDESTNPFTLPRPMLHSPDYDFSFSGLKTAVLYTVRNNPALQGPELDTRVKEQLSRAFEDAATEVLVAKTMRALEDTQAQTLVIGGGVSANAHIRNSFVQKLEEKLPHVELSTPPQGLTGDNAVMIGIAGFYRTRKEEFAEVGSLIANGNLMLAKKNAS